MSKGHRHGRDLHPVRAAARALGMSGSTLMRLDQDGPRFVATILVWAHWFVVALTFVQLAYRPAGWAGALQSCMRRRSSCSWLSMG